MTDRTPAPGSPWSKYCPEAWPREWLDVSRELPSGFTRPADPLEADLITGRLTEAAFLHTTGRGANRSATPSSRSEGKRKPNAVIVKLLGYRRFLDGLPTQEPRLSAGAVALWCWLWTCERKGLSRCTSNRMANRFRVVPSTAKRWLAELRQAGFVRTVRRGKPGRCASVVHVRPTPAPPHSDTR